LQLRSSVQSNGVQFYISTIKIFSFYFLLLSLFFLSFFTPSQQCRLTLRHIPQADITVVIGTDTAAAVIITAVVNEAAVTIIAAAPAAVIDMPAAGIEIDIAVTTTAAVIDTAAIVTTVKHLQEDLADRK
jgi:hypothetical protein